MGSVERNNLRSSTKFVSERLLQIRGNRKYFSIRSECSKIPTLSPTLVSLVLKGKRFVTLDRVDDWSALLKLNTDDKQFLRQIVKSEMKTGNTLPYDIDSRTSITKRPEISDSILANPIYIYVKDAFQIKEIQTDPSLIYKKLSFVSDKKSIDRSIRFLLKEGYLRKTLDGKIVIDQPLSIREPTQPHLLVRKFHKKALKLAFGALDTVSIEKRLANTLIIPLNKKNYEKMNELIKEFTTRLKEFAENQALEGDNLYQLSLNLSPTGDL